MSTKYFILAILLLSYICGAYSQRLNLDDSKNISVKSLTKYNKWRGNNKRNYLNDDEQLFRQLIFLENLKKVEEHNSNPKNTFTVDTNQFSDMTQEEFASRILNYNSQDGLVNNLEEEESISFAGQTATVASSIDWRTKGAVTPVKTQGRCGACWTFGTVGVMEGFNKIKNGKLQTFSEQQILDCAIPANGFSSQGCQGGSVYYGLTYAMKFGAVEATTYPYVGAVGSCKIQSVTNGFKPQSLARLANNPDALKQALNNGPVAVGIDASLWSMYKSGIFNLCPSPVMVNHAVLAVGYDTEGNWIIKNSWGSTWGDQGYIKIQAGSTCGITSTAFVITS